VTLNLLLTVIPAAIIAICAVPILSTYGKSYREAWPILAILALSSIPEALNNILGHVLMSKGRVWWRLAFDGVLAVALVGLSYWAIPRWGAIGLAAGYGFTFSLVATGLLIFLRNPELELVQPPVLEEVNK
jgi:O-antigen/teichoic acid export membrane protein